MGNGFYWTSVKGYRGSYLTAYNNGDYGIYSYSATDGQFDNSRTITEETTIDMKPAPTTISPSITIGGPGLANPVLESIPGFYMYLLPLSLYVVWLSLATWDLVRRSDIKSGARIGWQLSISFLF